MSTPFRINNDILYQLSAASRANWPALSKTHLQSLLYFCAILAPVRNIQWGYDFTTARFGPFNAAIQDAVDGLVIRELVSASTTIRTDHLRSAYCITSNGQVLVDRISVLPLEHQRRQWINEVALLLDIYGTPMLGKLTRLDPAYDSARLRNERVIGVSQQNSETIRKFSKVVEELEKRYSVPLDSLASKLIAYFDFSSSQLEDL